MSLDEINEEISAVRIIPVFPQPTGAVLIDMDDLIFYEVAMEMLPPDIW